MIEFVEEIYACQILLRSRMAHGAGIGLTGSVVRVMEGVTLKDGVFW